MTFGEDRTIACVHCRSPLVLGSFASISSIGAVVWTDGFVDSPRSPTTPVVAKCPACGRWFSINDAPLLADEVASGETEEVARIEARDTYSSEEYREALDNAWDRETEIALRLRLWWRENRPRRLRPGATGSVSDVLTPVLRENLKALLELLDEKRALLRAEALRELGKFDAAVRSLGAVVPVDEYDSAPEIAAVIRWETLRENTLPAVVRKVPPFSPRLGLRGPELSFPSQFEAPRNDERETFPDVTRAIRGGFYPLPFTEDLFAFPTAEKEERFSTMIALRLGAPSGAETEVDGWIPFMEEEYTLWFQHGRLFTEEEREQFASLGGRAKERLSAFWGIKSYRLPPNENARDRYFRDLFYLFWHGPGALPEESDYKRPEEFSETWEKLLEEKYLLGRPFNDWFELNRSRIYWDLYWRAVAGEAEPREFLGLAEIEEAMIGDLTFLHGIRRKRMELVENRPAVAVETDSPSETRLLYESGHPSLPGKRLLVLNVDRESGRVTQRES
jgi:hypothetical protein